MVVTSAPESTARPLPTVSAGLVSSTPPSPRRTSPQATKASAGSPSKSALKSPTKAAAGSSRRAPPSASALNARAINSLELQALEASDAEVLGWSSGAAYSAARATSASLSLVVDSPSPPMFTPTPAPVGTSSRQRQTNSDDSADAEVALQWSRRLRKNSGVESDESSDSVTDVLVEKPAFPLPPASVSPAPSTGHKRPPSPVTPASTKMARASTSAKSSSPARPVAKSASRARPTAKYSKSGKSAKSADPITPASGQSASASAPPYPDALDPRCPSGLKRLPRAGPDEDRRDPPFFHLGPARCWDQVMGSCVVEIQKETVDGKPLVRSTPSSQSGLTALADVPAIVPQVGSSRQDRGGVLAQAPWRSPRNGQGVDRPLRAHTLARGFMRRSRSPLHPDLNPTSSADELALAYQLWQKYSHERKRRSDALRSVLTELYGTLYKAAAEFDAASNTPAP
ncbi:unnamed protein product [Phytophthora fragariaefolia]|uniref:Unnamed protein product n=1 Tax=Phytophthora fragariaefolia TaxID=1490495 RepID=A0A9W6X0S2_9STRA|nr:unnamed protein product [Phytophthora fragariaefolia]